MNPKSAREHLDTARATPTEVERIVCPHTYLDDTRTVMVRGELLLLMFAAGQVSAFVARDPTFKMMAVSILLLIGVTLLMLSDSTSQRDTCTLL